MKISIRIVTIIDSRGKMNYCWSNGWKLRK